MYKPSRITSLFLAALFIFSCFVFPVSASTQLSSGKALTTVTVVIDGVEKEVPASNSSNISLFNAVGDPVNQLAVYVPLPTKESQEYIEDVVNDIHNASILRNNITEDYIDPNRCLKLISTVALDRDTLATNAGTVKRINLKSFGLSVLNEYHPLAYASNNVNAYVEQVGFTGVAGDSPVQHKDNYTVKLGSTKSVSYRPIISDPNFGYTSNCSILYTATIYCYTIDSTDGDMIQAIIEFPHHLV